MARRIVVESYPYPRVEDLQVELVERKGLGHPDTICDAAAEAVSRELSKYYLERFGKILHHNVDKVLLVGGQAAPRLGGGEVLQPIYILVSGRVTTEVRTGGGVESVPVGPIILRAVKNYIRENFRFLDPEEHVIVDYRVGRGSVDLVGIFEAEDKVPLANDTSIGSGHAPLSTLERLVLETERILNSRETKERLPAVGEDVKVMGVRDGKSITLTVAMAVVSSQVGSVSDYLAVKEEAESLILDLASRIAPDYDVRVNINTGDIPEKKILYLTVTGTSAEHGDDGATGRGNRVNGLITPMRPMSMEAAAGKNPVNHVGKIYNVVANEMAALIHREVKGVEEVYVKLVSQIGKPIDRPRIVDVKVRMEGGREVTADAKREIEAIANSVLDGITGYTEKLVRGDITVY
ncbi:S-adenosylmethionine synthetase [Aeropyrum pernix K1]|uniref:S-adenosylmethionine synthase n=1 Tax=Aeropyrum pernix (strain ATCC 700893 / DSM 11879 / JCM 9820 / NBRC 100138 / K1) TaxID=272557 RepID=METK_AERPE|nr:methionine adenosyltransferase [Aeropyrum pernix]Q9YBK2.1 RecName: Full=S-adenosylmethionine synthase; Short=AdoMet synthase; AltName: Full=Methionine adenosyltransferase [Aeropyrum pernix K1]BAA80596.1 S-adenosylmethionine synthetase [Aeropyrum pernix K1]